MRFKRYEMETACEGSVRNPSASRLFFGTLTGLVPTPAISEIEIGHEKSDSLNPVILDTLKNLASVSRRPVGSGYFLTTVVKV